MKRLALWITLASLVGCAVTSPPPPAPVALPTPPTLAQRLSALDPDDGKRDVALVLGTDDDLFAGQIDTIQYYIGCLSLWANEIVPHIDGDAVIFLSHGHDANGVWVCEYGPPYFYTLDAVVTDLRSKMGPRNAATPIVLLVCNPWGHDLTHDRNVWYAKHNIFLMPDSAMESLGGSNRRDLLPCGDVVVGAWIDFKTLGNH